jgi:hypothetical protein
MRVRGRGLARSPGRRESASTASLLDTPVASPLPVVACRPADLGRALLDARSGINNDCCTKHAVDACGRGGTSSVDICCERPSSHCVATQSDADGDSSESQKAKAYIRKDREARSPTSPMTARCPLYGVFFVKELARAAKLSFVGFLVRSQKPVSSSRPALSPQPCGMLRPCQAIP